MNEKQFTPNGKIRSCTKKMDEPDFSFADLSPESYGKLKKIFGDKERIVKLTV